MRILFVADGRSPIVNNWIAHFIESGDEVHLASTFQSDPVFELASYKFVPVAFSQVKKSKSRRSNHIDPQGFLWSSSLVNLRTAARRFLSPLTLSSAAGKLKDLITEVEPDLVHAMRIPFEGMLAAKALEDKHDLPLIISVWGNDFTLHAGANPWMRSYSRQAMARVDGLHTDCHRDLNLAYKWGFSEPRPAIVIPGNGGIQVDLFYPPEDTTTLPIETVINPRGIRSYIRNDTFFKAIPQVLAHRPGTRFVCPGMAGEAMAHKWIKELDITDSVDLLPKVSRSEMAVLFREAAVAVSPSIHDGTPNTLLEAMACGCFPVAGDLESVREWIEPGVNGYLVDPSDQSALAEAVISALEQPDLRHKARAHNQLLITERAEYQASMKKALDFYRTLIVRK
jgi:glycosyltransferase involved in cell wall biosynthesis